MYTKKKILKLLKETTKADQEAKKQPWCPYQVETNIEKIQQQLLASIDN